MKKLKKQLNDYLLQFGFAMGMGIISYIKYGDIRDFIVFPFILILLIFFEKYYPAKKTKRYRRILIRLGLGFMVLYLFMRHN